jgi:hypothetical protein
MGQTPSTIPQFPYEQPQPHSTEMNQNGKITSITKNNKTYNLNDIVSYIDGLGYENVVKIIGISFDQQSQKYVLNLAGDGFNDIVFIDSITGKKDQGTSLSSFFNIGDHISVNVNGGDVVAEIVGITKYKNNETVDTNSSRITYKYANHEKDQTNFGSVKKVHKDTLLTSPNPLEKNKKYTLEDDSRYRFKYAKYKAKYLIQKNK